jgi:hypothetical protein
MRVQRDAYRPALKHPYLSKAAETKGDSGEWNGRPIAIMSILMIDIIEMTACPAVPDVRIVCAKYYW